MNTQKVDPLKDLLLCSESDDWYPGQHAILKFSGVIPPPLHPLKLNTVPPCFCVLQIYDHIPLLIVNF